MSAKHKSEVQDLDVSQEAKAYVATQIELDRALERLVNELEEAGKLDKTVFVLLADHYPYGLSKGAIDSLSTYDRDSVVEINHNALIIWNSAMEEKHISKTCMSVDVLPTVLNLFGVEYDSRVFTGRDILSNSQGIAIMRVRVLPLLKRKGQGENLGPFGLIGDSRTRNEEQGRLIALRRRWCSGAQRNVESYPKSEGSVASSPTPSRCSEASSPTPCYYLYAVLSERSVASSPAPYLFPVILLKD